MTDVLGPAASACEIATAVRAGVQTATEVVEATLARIDSANRAVNAFTVVVQERARARAAALDAARRRGDSAGPLAGVPFAVKAMIDIAGVTTSGGSMLFRDAPAAGRDADIVRSLENAGAICVGALNMDEFGMGGTTENARFSATRNPHDLTRTAGGSSGGSAAALAAGMVPLTLGGDALGSIRLPASLCGVFGLRPTRGTVSSAGTLGSGGTISTVGPMARTVEDLRTCHGVLTGSSIGEVGAQESSSLRIGVAGGYFNERLEPDARSALELATWALAVHEVVEFPHARTARAAAMLVNASESATDKIALLRSRASEFDPSTRDRFLAHALVPAQWYLQAQRFREWHGREVHRMFESVDVVIMPATPCVAPVLGTSTLNIDGADLPVGLTLGWFTQPLAITDCPVLCVPIPREGRLPIGVQLLAPPGREAWLFAVANRLCALGVAAASVSTLAR